MPKFRQGRKPTSNQQLLPSPKGTSRHSFSQGSGSDSDSDTSNIQDAEDLHFVEMAHSVQVLSGLNSLRLSRIFCDVTLCVDDQEFTCHKIVLASFSPYFKVSQVDGWAILTIRPCQFHPTTHSKRQVS